VKVDFNESLKIGFAGKHEPHILRVFAKQKPSAINLDGKNLPEGDAWVFDSKAERLIIKTRAYGDGSYEVSWR
jgi:hypothetical protein